MKKYKIEATIGNLSKAIEFIGISSKDFHCPDSTINEILIACEEIIVNIISYAYHPAHKGEIEIIVSGTPGLIMEITITDNGSPFDPISMPEPDTTKPIEEREIGGLGIFLVKKLMDSVHYKRESNMNIIKLSKKIDRIGKEN